MSSSAKLPGCREHLFLIISVLTLVSILTGCGGGGGSEVPRTPLQQIETAIASEPNDDSLYHALSVLLSEAGRHGEAGEALLRALSIDSTRRPEYHIALSQAYLMQAESRKALDAIDAALRLFPNHIPSLLEAARLRLILQQHIPAMALLDKVFLRDPSQPDAWYLAGHLFLEMGDTARAVNAYQKAVDTRPDMRNAWKQLGDVLTALHIERAISYYDNALRLDSTEPELYHNKAYALNLFGNRAEAIELFRQLCSRFPSYEPGFYHLALLLAESDSTQAAVEHFGVAIRLNPSEAGSYLQRAKALQKLGDRPGARSDLETALRLDPGLEEARVLLKSL
ncbi:MAG: tetratricopeptide repeat protein [Saprospiraceae bacterium]|jgi:tetratricopeptide (TPR) repeat protein|nr:tetratricopeptide repeat protein [Saprospiraceae bacterium]MBP9211085.1 tetratricopeptide repeat protein [Saprospiraceae bacterium]MBV6473987.1 Beta-barrel assembly-enhancing protease [Saprospiraceae bacterium]